MAYTFKNTFRIIILVYIAQLISFISFAISKIMIIRAAGIFFILLVSFKQIFIIVYFPSILLLKEEVIEKFKQVKEYVYQEVEEKDDEEKALEIK